MKKVLLFFTVIAFAGATMTSCSKEITCECTTDSNGQTATSEVTIEANNCDELESSVTSGGITVSTTCEKK